MQLPQKKMPKLKKAELQKLLTDEDLFITNLLTICEVPETVEDNIEDSKFLLNAAKKITRLPAPQSAQQKVTGKKFELTEEQQQKIMQNKIQSKKTKMSDRTIKKKELKKQKKIKRGVGALKAAKNEAVKQEVKIKSEPDIKEEKKESLAKVFNKEGKIVFSKFDFAAGGTKKSKSFKTKTVTNPKEILQHIKKQEKEIKELVAQGDNDKAQEKRSEMAWKKAFDKVEGLKIKDDQEILKKAIKKRAAQKKKSKTEWKEREKKVERDNHSKQKKREENIDKRQKDNKNTKLRQLAKRGKVIGGF